MSPKPDIWDVSESLEPSTDYVELPAVEADDLAMIIYTSRHNRYFKRRYAKSSQYSVQQRLHARA